MADREKVIKGLEYHLKELSVGKTCCECPYFGDNPCEIQLIANALELLKEQEPVEPIRNDIGIGYWHQCGACGAALGVDWKYCHNCGRMVKTDE